MPYLECNRCRAKFYSAARRVNVDACPECGVELAPAGHFSRDELRPAESAAQRMLRRIRADRAARSV